MRRPFLFYLRPLCFLCSNSTFSEAIDFRIHARNPTVALSLLFTVSSITNLLLDQKMAARQLPSVPRHEVGGDVWWVDTKGH